MLVNSLLHDPSIGYDAEEHAAYMDTLAKGSLPSASQSDAFYVPPLPYAAALLPTALGISVFDAPLKFAQLLNVLYSVVLLYYVVRICRLIRRDQLLAIWTLLLLGSLPVYYRTMAFVRGEALAACLVVVALHHCLVTFGKGRPRLTNAAALGVLLALAVLSKQWAWFAVAAICAHMGAAALRNRAHRGAVTGSAALVLALTITAGGWFYAYLDRRFGSPMAFNHPPATESLLNRPRGFYLSAGLDNLFSDPIREAFSDPHPLLLPLFYADVWGDYWCYWSVYGWDVERASYILGDDIGERRPGKNFVTNRWTISAYLGHVNALALTASALLVSAVLLAVSRFRVAAGKPDGRPPAALALLALTVVASLSGYLALLGRYPDLDVKATYMLQIFPPAAILGGEALLCLGDRVPRFATALKITIVLAAIHRLPLFITRFPSW